MGRVHAAAVRATGGRVVAVCGSQHRDPEEVRASMNAAFGDIGIHWCALAEFVTGERSVRLISQTVTVLDWVAVDGIGGSRTFDRQDPTSCDAGMGRDGNGWHVASGRFAASARQKGCPPLRAASGQPP